ncbi:hypothetical protein [Spirosoma arcticum]
MNQETNVLELIDPDVLRLASTETEIAYTPDTFSVPGSDGLNITVEDITPELAGEFLTRNQKNRPLNQNHIAFLAAQMRAGAWQFSGDPIRFSTSGRLLDGQHRLSAIIASGTTQKTMVIWDLPEESFHVMDTGRMRMAADVLDIADVPNARKAASTVRMIIAYQRGHISATLKNQGRVSHTAVTHGEILEFVKQTDVQPYLLRAMTWYKEWRVFTGSEYGFIYYTLCQIDCPAAEQFLTSLASGANLPIDSPVFVLRKKLEQYKLNKVSCSPSERLALTFKAWNLYRKGAPVKMLTYNSEREEFPIPQ